MFQDISQVLSDFLTGFQRNPTDVQETTELHKQLFSALYRQFAQVGAIFELDRSSVGMTFQSERKKVRINPVRTAYPPKEKFDVVVLGKEGTTQGEDTYNVYWQQPVAFAVNIHLCLEEEQVAKYLKAQQKDLRKMATFQEKMPEGAPFIGLSLLLTDAYLGEDPGPEIEWELKPGRHAWVVTPEATHQYLSEGV